MKNRTALTAGLDEVEIGWFGTYDSISGRVIRENIPFTHQEEEIPEEASHVEFSISRTVEELSHSIGLSGFLSASYLGNSAATKAVFIKERVTSSATTFISVYSKYVNRRCDVVGDTTWRNEYKTRTPMQIFSDSGDAYVTSAAIGAEFYAVYSFSTETEAEQTQLMTELAATGIVDGARIHADFQSKLDDMRSTYAESVSFAQQTQGAPGSNGSGTLVQYAAASGV